MPVKKRLSDQEHKQTRGRAPVDASLGGGQRLATNQVILSRQTAQTLQLLLTDIEELLDSYGPVWYSEELQQRLSSALKMLDDEL